VHHGKRSPPPSENQCAPGDRPCPRAGIFRPMECLALDALAPRQDVPGRTLSSVKLKKPKKQVFGDDAHRSQTRKTQNDIRSRLMSIAARSWAKNEAHSSHAIEIGAPPVPAHGGCHRTATRRGQGERRWGLQTMSFQGA
jgi:hypothetical protein